MYLLCAIAPNWIPLQIKEPKWSKQTSTVKHSKTFFFFFFFTAGNQNKLRVLVLGTGRFLLGLVNKNSVFTLLFDRILCMNHFCCCWGTFLYLIFGSSLPLLTGTPADENSSIIIVLILQAIIIIIIIFFKEAEKAIMAASSSTLPTEAYPYFSDLGLLVFRHNALRTPKNMCNDQH